MKIEFLHYIFRLVWGLSIIGIFFFLPLWWAIFAIIGISLLLPVLGAILYAPFRKKLSNYPIKRDILSGALEALAFVISLIVLSQFIAIHKNFSLSLVILYSTNQFSRMYRNPHEKADVGELRELCGFIVVFMIYFLVKNFI